MGDAFGRFIAVILMVAGLVLVSIGFMCIKTENAKGIYAREVLESFYADMAEDNQITVEGWELFQTKLARNGCLYKTDICIGRYEETVAEKFYTTSYTDEIIEQMYRDGVYYLKDGDAITITVKQQEKSGIARLLDRIFNRFGDGFSIKAGGIVGE